MLKTKSVWSPINRGADGLRILTTRFRGRGMPSSRYQAWMPSLGPSERLLKAFQGERISWAKFAARYRAELFMDGPIDSRSQIIKNHGQKFTLRLIKRLARSGDVTLMCHCADDEHRCHRHLLRKLILSSDVRRKPARGEANRQQAKGRLSKLADSCIYTIKHSNQLRAVAKQGGTGTFSVKSRWVRGRSLLHDARKAGEHLPVIFAAAEATAHLRYWAILTNVVVDETIPITKYTFTGLRRLPSPLRKSRLRKQSDGKPLSDNFIRPYAICDTPSFLTA